VKLAQYGRFLDPIGKQLLRSVSDSERPALERRLETAKGHYDYAKSCARTDNR
jgi:hypothetical protein